MASARDALINLHIIAGQVYVWHPKEVDILRKEHHIIGSLIGSLPGAPRQNAQLSLPLQLMPEEATLLLHHGVARLVTMSVARPRKSQVQDFNHRREETIKEQKHLWQEEQSRRKEELREVIEEGRKRKRERLMKTTPELPHVQPAGKQECDTAAEERLNVDCERGESNGAERTQAAELEVEKSSRPDENTAGFAYSTKEYKDDDVKRIDEATQMKMGHEVIRTEESTNIKLGSGDDPGADTVEGDENCPEKGRLDNEDDVSRVREGSTAINTNAHSLEMEHTEIPGPSHMKDDAQWNVEIEGDALVGSRDEQNERDGLGCPEVAQTRDRNAHESPPACDNRIRSVDEDANLPKGKTADSIGRAEDMEDRELTSSVVNDGNVKEGGCSVQLFTAEPLDSEVILEAPPRMWHHPSNEREELRYQVFSHFWQMGYFLTSGTKFGGDFLVYPGDPLLFHSYFIVVCVPHHKQLSPLELISHGRLGTFVKKTVVLCSLTRAKKVVTTSLQWAGMG